MEKSTRLADVTHSGTNGWARYKGTVKEASGTVKASFDSGAMIDTTLQMDVGAEVDLQLYLGDSGKYYYCQVVIEKIAHQVNNQSGEVTYDFSWKSTGSVTNPS